MIIGTVLELNKNNAIVMSEKSNFLKIKRKNGMYVGQQILFHKSDILPPANENWIKYIKYSAASILVLLIGYFLLNYTSGILTEDIYAVLELESNDRLVLEIDKDGNIVNGLIKDDTKTEDVNENKLEKIIKKYIENHLIPKSNGEIYLVVSTSLYNEEDRDTYLSDIKKKFESALEEFEDRISHIEFVELSSEERENAIKNNLSMAKYFAYKKFKSENIEFNIEDALNLTIKGAYKEKNLEDLNNWDIGFYYKINEKVLYKGKEYICLNNNVSQDDWTPEKAVSLWKEIDNINDNNNSSIDIWQKDIEYKIGDKVIYNNIVYKCIQAHKSMLTWEPDKAFSLWAEE